MNTKYLINKVGDSLLKFYCDCGSIETFMNDPIRNCVRRTEILAVLLLYLCKTKKRNEIIDLIIKNVELEKIDITLEYGYKSIDDQIGYYGAIPIAFWLIALSEYCRYSDKDNTKIQSIMTNLMDCIYQNEGNGYLRKTSINRFDVLNTNLLVGLGFWEASKIFDENSTRNVMYSALARRTIFRVITFQRYDGFFPYQSDTPRINLIYHNMVVSILKKFQLDMNDPTLSLIINRGTKAAIKSLKSNGTINWDMQEINDKNGASWAYGWLLSCINPGDLLDKVRDDVLIKCLSEDGFLSNENENWGDKFYTSWTLMALLIGYSDSISQKDIKINISSYIRYFIIMLICRIRFALIYYDYLKMRVKNYIFHTGRVPGSWR